MPIIISIALQHMSKCTRPWGKGLYYPLIGVRLAAGIQWQNTDMRCPSVELGSDPFPELLLVAPRHNRIDQTLASAIGEIVVTVPQVSQSVHIMVDCQIGFHITPRQGTGFGGIGFQ
jgi:hypothetical protein